MGKEKKMFQYLGNWDYLISIPKNTQILGNSVISFNMNEPCAKTLCKAKEARQKRTKII